MQHNLTPSYQLTTDHSASSHGVPVLVQRSTGQAYGPADLAVFYESYGLTTAAYFVLRLLKTNPTAKEAIQRFCASWPDGPQVTD